MLRRKSSPPKRFDDGGNLVEEPETERCIDAVVALLKHIHARHGSQSGGDRSAVYSLASGCRQGDDGDGEESLMAKYSFRDDQNPYASSEVIVATVVDRRPRKRRDPLLAVVFIVLSLPFVAFTAGMWCVAILFPPANIPPLVFWLMAAIPMSAFTFVVLWIPFISCRECVQWLRGR